TIQINVYRFSKGDLIELLHNRFMEALTNAIGLWRHGLGVCVVDVIDCQVQLIVVMINPSAELSTPVCQYAQYRQVVLFVEWHYLVIEQVSRRDRGLSRIQLAVSNLGIGIDTGLLINPTNALEVADIKRVLRS